MTISLKPSKLTVIIFFIFLSVNLFARDNDKNLWVEWEINNPTSNKIINHSSWQIFLDKYLTGPKDGLVLVKYARVTPQDHKKLKAYIAKMAKTKITDYNRKEQLAYWLNIYNALVVNLILEHYPIDSIQEINISPGLFSTGPWEANLFRVQGFNISLSDIKNRIIRPIWNDPRTLYALSNGTIGGPNLHSSPFLGEHISDQLNKVASIYINSPRGVQITQNKLLVSQIFEWYEEDFGGTKQDVLKHIKLYANPNLKANIKHFKTINGYIYNWHINSQRNDV